MDVDGRSVQITDFLAVETRQVWALRRDTEEPVYLPVGAAKEMRAEARAALMCPFPGCVAEISTRGGSRRDGFFHLKAPGHDTGFESEAHLAGKAMLAAWGEDRKPDGATVEVEASIKTNKNRSLRRPDVLVLGAHGGRVAYEVEYKNFAIDAWRAKQGEYEAEGIACAWLIGHSRLRLAEGYGTRPEAPVVTVPALAAAIAADEAPLYVINPTTRQIGTLGAWSGQDTPYRGEGTAARLHVDALKDCRFDRRLGLLAPSMVRLLANEARLKEEAARQRAELAAREAKTRVREQRLQEAWEATGMHAAVLERCGGTIPRFLTVYLGAGSGIEAAPAYWRSAVFLACFDGCTRYVGFNDVLGALQEAGIPFSRKEAGASIDPTAVEIGRWLGHLEKIRAVVLTRQKKFHRSSIVATHPNGLTLEQLTHASGETTTPTPLMRLPWSGDVARTRLVITEDGKRRWVPKGPTVP